MHHDKQTTRIQGSRLSGRIAPARRAGPSVLKGGGR